ncbi:ComF family protein [Lactococcus garvieae]|uniref:ComF family protein n=1 Tax=Lactococcus garvieae TaxID=1363 RepID=UPI0018D890F9|nr:ComF family protein [Lactococcus garvieae]QPS71586.1 ComF family protein [Lactococcus garvieae]
MKCLLCHSDFSPVPYFHQLFLLAPSLPTLCTLCDSKFQLINAPHCERCYKAEINGVCSDCLRWERKGLSVNHRAVFTYNPAMEEYFSLYKFMGDYRLRKAFSHYFKAEKNYTLVPIPVSTERYHERGFNQVLGFLEHLNYTNLLVKKDTAAQSSLSRAERLKNKNTFTIKAKVKIPKKVLLVDDIYTTGNTIQQAIAILKSAGVQEIKSFSLCR